MNADRESEKLKLCLYVRQKREERREKREDIRRTAVVKRGERQMCTYYEICSSLFPSTDCKYPSHGNVQAERMGKLAFLQNNQYNREKLVSYLKV